MADQENDNGEVEDAEIREATPGDYLVTRNEDGELKPMPFVRDGVRHVLKPFTYREATEYYGDGQGVTELDDDDVIDLLKEKFIVPDLSGIESTDDMKPSAPIRLLGILHEASEINVDIEDGDGYKRVDFAEDEKKTG